MTFYVTCRKCEKLINSDDGYWEWKKDIALKEGYYHPECGTMNNPVSKGFDPLS